MKLCKNCATQVASDAMICPNCGASLESNSRVIDDYVSPDSEPETNSSEQAAWVNSGLMRGPYKKWISLVLCILLGWLGAHRFYEGKFFTGILYLLTFGLFGVGIVFDLLRLAGQPKEYYISNIPFLL